ETIDTGSNSSECQTNGGYWIPGTNLTNISVRSDTGWISATSTLGTFAAACSGDANGCGTDSNGNSYAASSFGDSGLANSKSWTQLDQSTEVLSPSNPASLLVTCAGIRDDYLRQVNAENAEDQMSFGAWTIIGFAFGGAGGAAVGGGNQAYNDARTSKD